MGRRVRGHRLAVGRGDLRRDGFGSWFEFDIPGISVHYVNSWRLANQKNWVLKDYTRTIKETKVKSSSQPAQILSGAGIHISTDKLLNDKSHILAGGEITGDSKNVENPPVPVDFITKDSGTVTSIGHRSYKPKVGGRKHYTTYSTVNHESSSIKKIKLTPSRFEEDSKDMPKKTGAEIPVYSGNANINIPTSSLFNIAPNPTSNYIIETDPRFANYREWLSSDYLLKAMATDPATVQKRLGDGFYEQRLIREQVAQLTGRRFLNTYTNDEAQYQALMGNAVNFAKVHQLRPGIALSAEQMAQLTSDIVWLVEKEITLPNGQTTKVLVPQLYVRMQDGDLPASGGLISANSIDLNLKGDLTNGGTIMGHDGVKLTAENIHNNSGGVIRSKKVAVHAHNDINNIGGQIKAVDNLTATAEHDLKVISTTSTQSNAQGSRTNIYSVAGLYVTGAGGTLTASAGHDAIFNAAAISNFSSVPGQPGGKTKITAVNNIDFGTIAESTSNNIVWDSDNWLKDSSRTDIGTTFQTQGDIRLEAGNDLNAKAASVTSEQGAILATAVRDINIVAGENNYSIDEAHKHTNEGSWSDTTITTRDTISETIAQGSTFSGKTTKLQAGRDTNVKGSNIISDEKTTLEATNNVNIEAATNTINESHYKHEKTSGIYSSGGASVNFGTKEQSTNTRSKTNQSAASTIGSTAGNVEIKAGKNYKQVGSDILTPKGDIYVNGKRVDILEARDVRSSQTETKFKQTGVTLAITNPVISAIQTANQLTDAASQTKDTRMQVLAGATGALAAKNTYDAVKANPSQVGGVNVSLSVGTSKRQSNSTQNSDSAASSNLTAGGNIKISAIGDGQNSDLTVQGSNIKASDATLHADNKVNLLAAKNTSEQHSTNKNSSASVGVSVGSDGLMGTASLSGGRGKSDGNDLTHTNTHVDITNKLTIESGSDTNIKGAVASAKQVVADIGGNLNVESLQDTSTYHSKQQNYGVSVSAGYGKGSASANFDQTKMNSNFASVTEQSGIQAGSEGFQIKVKGNTDLKGATIASAEQAVLDGKNTFTTATLTQSDIQNQAEYDASSVGLGGGYSYPGSGVGKNQKGEAATGGKQVPGSTLPSFKGVSVTPPVAMSASNDASSTTRSGISPATITITDAKKQQELTGKDAAATIAGINTEVRTGKDSSNALKPIFDEKKKEEILAGFEITKSAVREVGTFLNNRAQEIATKQEQAKQAEAQAKDPNAKLGDTERQALYTQAQTLKAEAKEINKNWGPGGTYRQVLTALTAAAGNNIGAATGEFAKNAVVNFIQQQGAAGIGELVKRNKLKEGDPLHAAMHAIVAAAGAAASGQNVASGAAGAAASSLITNLFADATPNETQEEREAKGNLIKALVTGIAAAGAVPDVAAASSAATASIDNNFLQVLAAPYLVASAAAVASLGVAINNAIEDTNSYFDKSANKKDLGSDSKKDIFKTNEKNKEIGWDKTAEKSGAKAPGVPTEVDGYKPPKNWNGKKVKSPNGPEQGWPDDKGRVWVPTGHKPSKAHGGPHWDVQKPGGGYDNIHPGGKIRPGKK